MRTTRLGLYCLVWEVGVLAIMPAPFSEVLERCISGEGRAKLRNWLTSVLLPLLDGEAEVSVRDKGV